MKERAQGRSHVRVWAPGLWTQVRKHVQAYVEPLQDFCSWRNTSSKITETAQNVWGVQTPVWVLSLTLPTSFKQVDSNFLKCFGASLLLPASILHTRYKMEIPVPQFLLNTVFSVPSAANNGGHWCVHTIMHVNISLRGSRFYFQEPAQPDRHGRSNRLPNLLRVLQREGKNSKTTALLTHGK